MLNNEFIYLEPSDILPNIPKILPELTYIQKNIAIYRQKRSKRNFNRPKHFSRSLNAINSKRTKGKFTKKKMYKKTKI